jgi:tetratricopeptide (TPR) repeat protein
MVGLGGDSAVWHLRWALHHGVMRVRGWPEGGEESVARQVECYTGRSGWCPRRLTVRAGQRSGVVLEAAVLSSERAARLRDPAAFARARTLARMVRRLHRQGDHPLAVHLASQVVFLLGESLGSRHPRTALGLANLGLVLYASGERVQARPRLEQALAIQEETLGRDHPDTATTRSNLAAVLFDLGQYTQAAALWCEALRVCTRLLGPEAPRTVACREALARRLPRTGVQSPG